MCAVRNLVSSLENLKLLQADYNVCYEFKVND